jgi:hypothetical protein
MAIVKAKFTRKRTEVKTLLRYIIHRPGQEKERLTRELFGYDPTGTIAKAQGYELIDQAPKGTVFFHVILNFSREREDRRRDLNLPDITRQTMLALGERLKRQINFLAVEHNDHTELRHIHAIVMVKLGRGERLSIADWHACRKAATESARLQRRALDLFQVYRYERERHYWKPFLTPSPGMAGARARRLTGSHKGGALFTSQHALVGHTRAHHGRTFALRTHASCFCPRCHLAHTHDRRQAVHSCPSCGLLLHKKREVTLRQGKGRGLELSL